MICICQPSQIALYWPNEQSMQQESANRGYSGAAVTVNVMGYFCCCYVYLIKQGLEGMMPDKCYP